MQRAAAKEGDRAKTSTDPIADEIILSPVKLTHRIRGKDGNIIMKSTRFNLFIIAAYLILLTGCAATYHQDCTIYIQSDPAGAEIWKGDYYIGKTPYLITYTATTIEDEQGYLEAPPLTIKKDGYKPFLMEIKLDLEDADNYDWEANIPLEEIPEKYIK